MFVGCSGVQTVTRVESIDSRLLEEYFLPKCNDSRNIELLKCTLELEQGLCSMNCRMRELRNNYSNDYSQALEEKRCPCP